MFKHSNWKHEIEQIETVLKTLVGNVLMTVRDCKVETEREVGIRTVTDGENRIFGTMAVIGSLPLTIG